MKKALMLIVILLTACTPPAPTISQPDQQSTMIAYTLDYIRKNPLPTYTPYPTLAAVACVQPTSTEVPLFYKWNNDQVISAFKAAGLDAESPTLMAKKDYGLAPMSAVQGIHFLVPSLCSDCGGRVFSFNTKEDLDLTNEYYVKFGKSSAALFSWTFQKDNILVQINGDLPEDKAKLYEAALNNLK